MPDSTAQDTFTLFGEVAHSLHMLVMLMGLNRIKNNFKRISKETIQ